MSTKKKTLALFVDFAKFGCVACLSQFLDFCDSLKRYSAQSTRPNIVLLIERDQQDQVVQYRQMKSWTNAVGIIFPFYLVPSCMFTDNMMANISLMILDADASFDYYDEFPLTTEKVQTILDRIFRKHDGVDSESRKDKSR